MTRARSPIARSTLVAYKLTLLAQGGKLCRRVGLLVSVAPPYAILFTKEIPVPHLDGFWRFYSFCETVTHAGAPLG